MTSKLSRLLVAQMLAVAAVGLHAEEAGNPIVKFEIVRFEVEGSTLLTRPAVEQLLAPFAGKERNFGDVQRALKTLEDAYRKEGYSMARVVLPEQELNQGVVHFKVIETRLGKVTIEGNRVFDEANIRRSLPDLRAGEAPNLSAISRSLKVANENPAKKTTMQLQGSEQGDEVNVALKVADESVWSAGLSIDNTGDPTTGRDRVSVQLQHANIGGLDHVLSLQYITSLENPNKVSVYGLGYHLPLYALGDSIDFFGSYSDVNAGTVSAGLFDLQIRGKGTVLGTIYNHNFDRIGDYQSKLTGGITYKAFKNDVSMQGAQLGKDITVHPLGLAYIGNWASSAGAADFFLSGLRNIPGGEHGTQADFDQVRSGASATYTLLRYGFSYSMPLPRQWQLRFNFNGQSTRDALVAGEQFGAGGALSVRGFSERNIANDSGRVANLEIYTPNLCADIPGNATQCHLLGFYDNGYVSRTNPLPGELAHASIGSAGLGLRMSINKSFALLMDYGRVIDGSDTQAKGEQRLHFKVAFSY